MAMPFGMAELLSRKYAILQQEADATTQNAQSAALRAGADAGLTNAQAAGARIANQFAPDVARANVAQTRANTNLLGEQAKVIAPESRARIAGLDANTGYTRMNTRALYNDAVKTFEVTPSALSSVLGTRMPSLADYGFTPISATRPARRRGESDADYMDRTGWGL